MKNHCLWVWICMAGIVSMACNLISIVQQSARQSSLPSMVEAPTPTVLAFAPTQVQSTLTSQPTPGNPAQLCLVGTWEIANLGDYVLAAIPPDMANTYNLNYKGSSGNAYFTFSPDGSIALRADQLKFQFNAKVSLFTLPLTVTIDGNASGDYTIEANTLTTENMNTTGLTASAITAGQQVIDSSQIINVIPLLLPPYNTADYTCEGNSLQLKLQAYPTNIPPLTFQRVQP